MCVRNGACCCRRNKRPGRPKSLRIYEAHIGMSGEDERISTYAEFRDNVLPRIKKQGYTAIQLMAIQVCPFLLGLACRHHTAFRQGCFMDLLTLLIHERQSSWSCLAC